MTVTIRKLQVFLEVAENSSFRKAADKLGISQPSVSIQIASLEAELGYELFFRQSGARPRLTERGYAFVDRAEQLVASFALLDEGKASDAGQRRKLVVATGAAILERMKPFLPDVLVRHSDIEVEFQAILRPDALIAALDEQVVDLGIYTGALPHNCSHPAIIVSQVAYSIYCSPRSAEAWRAKGSERDPLPVALPPADGWMTESIKRRFREAGFDHLEVVGRSQFPDVLIAMAKAGHAAIALPDDTVSNHLGDGSLMRLRAGTGSGYRYMLLGPKALRSPRREVIEQLKDILTRSGASPSRDAFQAAAGV